MEKQTCKRCHCKEYIPTHQFVKFDEKIHYLCKSCWDYFRRWFYYGAKPESKEVDNAA